MRKMLLRSVFFSAVIVLGVGFLSLTAHKRLYKIPVKTVQETTKHLPSIAQRILSFNLEGYRDNGEKKWELKGSSADIFSQNIKLRHIVAKTFGEDVTLTLKANEGIYDKETQDVHLEGNVIGRTTDGARMLTDNLDWKAKEEFATTDALVRFWKDGITARGTGALESPKKKQVELKENISITISGETPTEIKCDGPFVMDYGRNISTLNKNVVISDKRGKIYSDKMKVLLNPKTRKIRRVVAIGNVKIIQGDNTTYSDRVIYTVRDGRIRLIGRPRVNLFSFKDE